MDSIVYIIIGIFVVLYIIDKKEPVQPIVEKLSLEEKKNKVSMTIEDKKQEARNEIYKSILNTVKEINPLKTYNLWTYIELTEKSHNLQLSYRKLEIPVFFKKCIDRMKKVYPDIIVLTPLNIKEYLPEFDIEMGLNATLPLKLRIDILFASILEQHGGLCLSPGTILYNVSNPLNLLKSYEIVTFGADKNMLQAQNHIYFPNSYVLGSQKGTSFIKEYKRNLIMMKNDTHLYNFKNLEGSDILTYLLKLHKPTQYHFGTEYDGSYNSKYQTISLKDYMGTMDIDFLNKDKLLFVSIPYDILLKTTQYKWLFELSDLQFIESNLVIKRLLLKDI